MFVLLGVGVGGLVVMGGIRGRLGRYRGSWGG